MKKTTELRQRLARREFMFVPGCYNALSAKILDAVGGFPALYMTGYGTSLSLLGLPDVGLATMTEMHVNARYIANVARVPVIADADTGYGNAVNVIRTVKEYIQTGVAAIHIEDQVAPKRCGHVAGRQVIPIDEAVGKIKAAVFARDEVDPDFVLIARTDARGAHGGSLDEAIRRANAYLAAGADVAFVEGPTSVEEVRRISTEVEGQIMYNQTGLSPRFSRAEYEALGIAIAIVPGATLRATMQAVYDLAEALREEGPDGERRFNETFARHPMGDFHSFAGFDQVLEWERRFMGEAELAKYEGSIGHRPKSAR